MLPQTPKSRGPPGSFCNTGPGTWKGDGRGPAESYFRRPKFLGPQVASSAADGHSDHVEDDFFRSLSFRPLLFQSWLEVSFLIPRRRRSDFDLAVFRPCIWVFGFLDSKLGRIERIEIAPPIASHSFRLFSNNPSFDHTTSNTKNPPFDHNNFRHMIQKPSPRHLPGSETM